jgi:ribosome-associated toxin RatA of RatAB toxin-antitoxin module
MLQIIESLKIPVKKEDIFHIVTDFKNFGKFFPYAKSVEIISNENNEIITQEIISFNYHGLKHEIEQSTTSKILNDQIKSQVISGPFKNTMLMIKFDQIENMTLVSIEIELKTNFKYKFISPLIKKMMKRMSLGVLYKMMTDCNSNQR